MRINWFGHVMDCQTAMFSVSCATTDDSLRAPDQINIHRQSISLRGTSEDLTMVALLEEAHVLRGVFLDVPGLQLLYRHLRFGR